ncbi:MAG: cytochrome C [Desulfuromonadaceae bacterium]|nr:cytochrome C [Desulfuromonadaceae bacterium]
MKLFLPIAMAMALLAAPALAADSENLLDADCVKCHVKAVQDVAAHGEAHAGMGCQDCHAEHPPTGTDVIPKCSLCHDPAENDHYKLTECSGCHYPHHPLQIDFSAQSNVKPACLTCHPDQGAEMAAHPSLHSEQDCNACHLAHGLGKGQYLNCLDCHEGHAASQTVADCTLCHKPHSPKEVAYKDDLASAQCAPCHDDIAAMLSASKKKHHELNCATCHSGQHMAITSCRECHDEPHGSMHQKFPNCVDCHLNPHALAE